MMEVVCDLCNEFFDEHDERKGGLVVGSHGVCPLCEPKTMVNIKKYEEQHAITATAKKDETFHDFIQRFRLNQLLDQVINNK